jgi:hypothetical protein
MQGLFCYVTEDNTMKYWLWILIFIVALSGCGEENVVDTDDATYRLRLVESVSKKPIATTSVVLVPRVILLKPSPGTPDPNLEYALELTTDDNGILYLDERKLRKLFSYFENGSGHVDCTVEGFSRFTIEYNPISKKYLLTVFDKNNQVRPLGDQFLIEGKAVELLLDKLSVPSSDNTLKQQDYNEAEDAVIENSHRIAADIGTITRTLDGCSLFVVRDPPIRSVSWLQHPNCIKTEKALRAGTLESRKGFALSTRGVSVSDVSSASLFSPFADGIGLAPIPGRPTAEALARTAPHRRDVPP